MSIIALTAWRLGVVAVRFSSESVNARARSNQYLGKTVHFASYERVELFRRGRRGRCALTEQALLDIRQVEDAHDFLVQRIDQRPRCFRRHEQSVPLVVFEARKTGLGDGWQVGEHRR